MSRTNQLGLHPDAESLNAFVEHLLPDEERQQLLSHLAVCTQCRQVVFLAQEAAFEQEAEKPVVIPEPQKPRKSWLTGWRPVWVMATACAAMFAISLPIYFRHAAQNQAIARMAQSESGTTSELSAPLAEQESRASQELATRPAAPSQSKGDENKLPALPGSSKPADAGANAAKNGPPVAKSVPLPGPATVPAPAPPAAKPQAVPPGGSFSEAVMVAPKPVDAPRPAITETIPTQPALSTNQLALQNRNTGGGSTTGPKIHGFVGAARAGMAPRAAMPAHGTNSAVAGTSRNVVAGTADGARLLSPTGAEILVLVPGEHISAGSEEELAAARDAMQQSLPSGQRPIFAASAQHHLLAIDAAGALFLSNDAGRTWEPENPQWNGRAVTLRVAQNSNGAEAAKQPDKQAGNSAASPTSAAGTGVASGSVAQQAPAVQFEIVNDSGSVWTSMDGKTWTAK